MITLLGTSHISERSSKEVKQAMASYEIVAIELDHGRAEGLLSEKRASFKELRAALGLKAAIMASFMRSLQERLAKSLGVIPGLEMKAALQEAGRQQKVVMLIDRDIRVTLKRLSSNFGWPEVKQMGKDLFRKREIPAHPDDELVAQLLQEMRETYPRIYKVMVAERDEYMAKALVHIQEKYPDKNILAVVGKGHVQGMLRQINYINRDLSVNIWPSVETNSKQSSS